jgi:hypothetical protein
VGYRLASPNAATQLSTKTPTAPGTPSATTYMPTATPNHTPPPTTKPVEATRRPVSTPASTPLPAAPLILAVTNLHFGPIVHSACVPIPVDTPQTYGMSFAATAEWNTNGGKGTIALWIYFSAVTHDPSGNIPLYPTWSTSWQWAGSQPRGQAQMSNTFTVPPAYAPSPGWTTAQVQFRANLVVTPSGQPPSTSIYAATPSLVLTCP